MRRAILYFLVAVSLAGCAGSAGTGEPTGASDASSAVPAGSSDAMATSASVGTPAAVGSLPATCSLLTAAEVGGVVGHSVAEGVVDGDGSCKWERTDVHDISVGVRVMTLPGTLQCQTVGTTPMPNLGDQAGWRYQANIFTGSITACRGRQQTQVTMIGDLATNTTTEDQLRADAVQLMTLVLGRF
jgi:hypothetical protein